MAVLWLAVVLLGNDQPGVRLGWENSIATFSLKFR